MRAHANIPAAKIGASVGLNEQEFYDLLKISDKPDKDGSLNTGNGVTNDLKVLVKMNRMQGVHVTPTVNIRPQRS